jgi:hypothetical protein
MLARMFPRNEHAIDRVLRVVLGLGLLSLIFVGPQTWWGLIGILPLATGLLGSCPVYTLFGVGTCRYRPKAGGAAGPAAGGPDPSAVPVRHG